MFSRIEDFRTRWQEEVVDTLKVLSAVPDEALDRAVTPEHRDLRRLAQHLVESIVQLPAQMGIVVKGADPERLPADGEGLRRAYEAVGNGLLGALEAAGWDDAELQKEDVMYGYMTWKRGLSLFNLMIHQAHHRGQMTVLLRQAGLVVPEFYGPTKESWATMGAEAPAI